MAPGGDLRVRLWKLMASIKDSPQFQEAQQAWVSWKDWEVDNGRPRRASYAGVDQVNGGVEDLLAGWLQI